MPSLVRFGLIALSIAAAATSASAQTQAPRAPSAQDVHIEEDPAALRPAGSTYLGDTGFWFVPTAEVLPRGRLAVSGYRVGADRSEQFASISHLTGGVAFGIADRLELFASIRARTRIDAYALERELTADERSRVGRGFPMDYPLIGSASRTGAGDLFVGGKVNLASESRRQPVSFALRGVVKLPTSVTKAVTIPLPYAAAVESLGTGKPDVIADAIASKEIRQRAELAGSFGVIIRGQPEGISLSNGFRLGIGAAFPTRSALRVSAELHGELYFDPMTFTSPSLSVCYFQPQYCLAGSHAVQDPLDAFLGVDYRHPSGFFVGGGVGFAPRLKSPGDLGISTTESFNGTHVEVRFGYHPGARVRRR